MKSLDHDQLKRRPTEGAEILRAFAQFPAPLALLTPEGEMVATNVAYQTRFGGARVVPESVRGPGSGSGSEGGVELRMPDRMAPVAVPARVFLVPDRILVVLDESAGARPEGELERLRGRVNQLERLVATDHLTGAWNRAHFDRLIEVELARSLASRQPVSLALLDIDHFKSINDRFGHGVGDGVLRELVQLVQSRIRASDFLFRWGGEEFAVLAATHGYRGAERMAQNLCDAVAAHSFLGVGAVTVSIGVAEHAGNESPADWFGRLDGALYAAKNGGRNRVVVDRRGNSDEWAAEAGVATLHLVWQEAYECGDDTIDGEHRELFVLANRLIDVVSRGEADPAAVRAPLDDLLGHVQRHFADEEAILARLRYDGLEPHRRAHAGLLRRAAFLKARAEAGEATLGSVVEFLVQDVIARHLMAVDRAFFPLFEKGSPAPAVTSGP